MMQPPRSPLDPEVEALLAALKAADVPALSVGTPDDARKLLSSLRPPRDDAPVMHAVSDADLPVADGKLRVRIYEPVSEPPASILYFHGGGWVVGSIETSDFMLRHIAEATGLRVIAGSYRLAPEYPFPTAVNDAASVLRWTRSWIGRLGSAKQGLLIAGDSAGGNLATVSALDAAPSDGPPIMGQVLFYPVVDHDFDRPSYRAASQLSPLSSEDMMWFWDHYAASLQDRRSPLASPICAKQLDRSPPTFLALADHDPLYDEGYAYGEVLADAGVPVEVKIYPGTVHGFLSMSDRLTAARTAMTDLRQFARRILSTRYA